MKWLLLSAAALPGALLATPSTAQAFDPLKAAFGFSCKPQDPKTSVPTYEYRVFLTSPQLSGVMPAKTRIEKFQGLAEIPATLELSDGNLIRLTAPAASDGKTVIPLDLIDILKDTTSGKTYKISAVFSIQITKSENGSSTTRITDSVGYFSIYASGGEKLFNSTCSSLR